MTIKRLKLAASYIVQGKFRELILRGRLSIRYQYGNLKYFFVKISSKDKYKIVTVNGYKMFIYTDDYGISKDLYLYKKRENFSTDFMRSILNEKDVILEIGANIGYYLLLESKIATKGKIFACEPMPFNFKLLERNIRLNDVKNADIYPFAVSDQIEQKEFYIYDKINWSSFNKNIDGKINSTIMLKTTTVDNFVNEHMGDHLPTFIRMDVEGWEYNIIKGSLNTLSKCDKLIIFMELHPHLLSQEKLDELMNILKYYGFNIKAIINECEPHVISYLNHDTWNSMEGISHGLSGNSFEDLMEYLKMGKGTSVFFEKIT